MLKSLSCAVLGAGLLLCAASSQAAEIRVMLSAGMQGVYEELGPQFEKATGHKLATTWAGTVDIVKKMRADESFDFVIVASNSLEQLAKEGKFSAGLTAPVAKSGMGVAVKSGAKKPDISSGEALKRTLLAAKSIAYSTGPSGVYMEQWLKRVGIADELKPRIKVIPPGTLIGDVIARGEAEIGFQQIQELLSVKSGIDYVGPLPPDVQIITVFSGGIPVNAKEVAGAKAFLEFLKAPAAVPVIRKHGMDPA
jgi:molybdate transport system substrate-binding protein